MESNRNLLARLSGRLYRLRLAAQMSIIGGLAVALTACGGGGGGGGGSQPPANVAPTAAIAANPTSGKAPLTVALDGSGSRDTDGTISAYTWSFSDGSPSLTGVTVSKTFNTAGNVTVTLTVTDNRGATGTATRAINVVANAAPTASFTATPTTGRAPLLVSFDGTGSRDTDGTIATYAWTFGDTASGTGATVQHTYDTAGTYTATLTVTDNEGATGTFSRTITVAPPVGSVSVTVKDTNGTGIGGATVVATVGGASRSATTNASGVALVTEVLTGTGTVNASRDTFVANSAPVTVTANTTTSVELTLVRVTTATGGVLTTRVPTGGVSADGRTLEFSIQVVVVNDQSGEVRGLPAGAFSLGGCTPNATTTEADCVSGGPADVAYTVLGPGADPSFQEIPGGPPQPYAAALTFDQSRTIIVNDPTDARLYSAKEFIDRLGTDDYVLMTAFADGSTSRIPETPVTYFPRPTPRFLGQAEAPSLAPDLDSLSSLEGGGTPLYEALCRVMDFTVANAPSGKRQAAVLFTDGRDDPLGSTGSFICRSLDRVIEKIDATGVDIFVVGLSGDVDGLTLATLADAGNGVFMFAEDVTQLIPIYGSLGNLLSGSLTTYRLTYRIQADADGTFQPGRSVRGKIAVNTGLNVNLPFVVRIF